MRPTVSFLQCAGPSLQGSLSIVVLSSSTEGVSPAFVGVRDEQHSESELAAYFLVFRCHTLFLRERSRLCGLSQLGNIDNSLHTSCLRCMLFFLYFPFYFIVLRHALHVEKHVLNAGRVPLSTTVGS